MSHPNSRRFDAAARATIREGEARRALGEVGLAADALFLQAPDGRLSALDRHERTALVDVCAHIVRSEAPDLVFAPWRRRDVQSPRGW